MVSAVFSRKFLTLIIKDDMITFVVLRMWRNWQTHKTQNLAVATSCGFKSRHPHKINEKAAVFYDTAAFL